MECYEGYERKPTAGILSKGTEGTSRQRPRMSGKEIYTNPLDLEYVKKEMKLERQDTNTKERRSSRRDAA